MPGPITSQVGLGHLTDSSAHLLLPAIEKKVNRLFSLGTPVTRELRRRATVERWSSHKKRVTLGIGAEWGVGHRDWGQVLPSQEPTANGTQRRIAESLLPVDMYLYLQYGGVTLDGPTVDLAKGADTIADPLSRALANLSEMMAYDREIWVTGRGTGELFSVSSVSGSVVTLKTSAGTVATAGEYGGNFLRGGGRNIPLVFYSSDLSTRRGTTNAGRVARRYNRSTAALTLNEAPPTLTAGDIAVLGDDGADELNAGPIGLDGWVDDGRRRQFLYGFNRSQYPELNSFRVDAQSGGALGEFSFPTLMRCVLATNHQNDGRALFILHHPYVSMEPIFGTQIDAGATRTQPGLQSQRQFMGGEGNLVSGGSTVAMPVPGLGRAEFMGAWNVRSNTLYGLDPATWRFADHTMGAKFLAGYALPQGVFIRQSTRDRYDAVMRLPWTMWCTDPSRNFRVDNILHTNPDF